MIYRHPRGHIGIVEIKEKYPEICIMQIFIKPWLGVSNISSIEFIVSYVLR